MYVMYALVNSTQTYLLVLVFLQLV